MKEINVQDFKAKQDAGEDFFLIDVREPYEHETGSIGGELIPIGEIVNAVDRIPKDKTVIVYCRSGSRSGQVVQYLEHRHQFDNLINLSGGIKAYSEQIDPSIEVA